MQFETKYYSVKHKNKKIQSISSSGGLFTALSDLILEQGGIVIGGYYNYNSNDVNFKICRSKEERDSLRGSKYIQGNMTEIYQQIETEIRSQKESCCPIMFIGTPCQVAAIKNYLKSKGIKYPKLVLCDLICHGVPSPGVWHAFFEKKQKKYNLQFITFKDKKMGWNQPLAYAESENKRISLRGFTLLYFGRVIMRPSCHKCPYASTDRVGDISLGDHWNVGQIDSSFGDRNGVSLAIVNTEKGLALFDLCKNNIEWRERTREECLQQALEYPATPNKLRKKFWDIYQFNGIFAIAVFDSIVAMEKIANKIFRK